MKIKLLFIYVTMLCCSCLLMPNNALAQVSLVTSPYVQNFDAIGSGLPAGFSVRTGASASSIGTDGTFISAAGSTTAWSSTSSGFKNYASGNTNVSSTSTNDQTAATDRALGLKQTGSFGDPGAAYVFQVNNTTGKTAFKLSFKLQSLYSTTTAGRTTTWIVQYGIGSNPTSFSDPVSVTDVDSGRSLLITSYNFFADDSISVDFGNALDNINDVVTIRIVALSGSSGGGSRASSAIDNFNLSWTAVSSTDPVLSATDDNTNNLSAISFPTTTIGAPSDTSFILNGQNLTSDINLSVTGTNFLISSDGTTFSSSLKVAAANAANKKIFVQFSPTDQGEYMETITASSTGATAINIPLDGIGYDPYSTDFEFNTCTNAGAPGSGFTQYSVLGSGQVWTCTNYGLNNTNGVNINGYASGANQDNEDWLISPKIIKTFNDIPELSYYSKSDYVGPTLHLLVSTDYDGVGNPNDFTWTDLNASFSSTNSSVWTRTDGIDLSAYKSAPYYIAFKYTSNANNGASRFTLDSIQITDVTSLYSATPKANDFGAVGTDSTSAGIPIFLKSINKGDITVAAPTNFEVSLDSSAYNSSINIASSVAENGTKFYVRLAPKTQIVVINDSLHITSTGGLDDYSVQLSGSSYATSLTLNIAAYNMSFFASSGSQAIVRTPAQITQQIDNIGKVIAQIGPDLMAFEEMSSDSGLNVMLANINAASGKHYKSSVSPYWSYKQEDDPTYPPQKIGILYDSGRVVLDPANPPRAMFGDSTNGGYGYANEGGVYGSSFFASGRLPYMITLIANIKGKKQRIRVVVVHGKAQTGSGTEAADAYNRRTSDAQVLYDSLNLPQYKNENIVILGDFNDRLSTSIYTGHPSSYKVFVDDNSYQKLTYTLDTLGKSSFPGDTGMIDNMLFRPAPTAPEDGVVYLDSTASIRDPRTYIATYDKVVGSDHLPISSRFLVTASDNSLPVKFLGLSATLQNKTVKLTWKTATELNSKTFIVQRSTDGKKFINIGALAAAGNSSVQIFYSYSDDSSANGVNYYRIEEIDKDGGITRSDVVSIDVTNTVKSYIEVYPNPVRSKLTLKLSNPDAKLILRLYSVTGALVLNAKGDLNTVNQSISQMIGKLTSGVYFIDLKSGDKHYQVKFIKE